MLPTGVAFLRKTTSGVDAFDAAVWFSRHLGQDADGCNLNHRMSVIATGRFQNFTAIGTYLIWRGRRSLVSARVV
jgi:hypothetical protein